MEISRILTLCLVFLITLKETLNERIPPEALLDKRSKRYHESNHDEFLKQVANDQLKNGREKKNAFTPTNIDPQVRVRPSNLILRNKNAGTTIIPQRQLVNIQPLNTKTKPNPYVFFVKNHNLVDKRSNEHIQQNEANKTLTNRLLEEEKLPEKELVVDKVVDDKELNKTISIFPVDDLVQNPVLEEEESIKPKQPETVKTKLKTETKKKSHKSNKIFKESENSTSPLRPKNILESDEYVKKDEPVIKLITEEEPNQEIKIDVDSKNEEKAFVDILTTSVNSRTNDEISQSTGENQVDKAQPQKHPFLEVIQSDLYRTCSPLDKPDASTTEVKDLKDDGNLATSPNQKETNAAFDLNSTHKKSHDKNDEIEGAIIRNKNYNEVIEIYRPPQVPVSPQFVKIQDNIDSVQYNGNYQTPYYDNYQAPKAGYDFNTNNQHDNCNINSYYPPDDQKIEQIDGATVVTYNNYYKTPTAYDNWNNNKNNNYYATLNPNINSNNYGYQAPAKQRTENINLNNNNRGYENQATRDVKERIWRSWKNTELNIKSKNVMKQLCNEKLYDLANQNNNADQIKFIQRRSASDLDGCYRNQNKSPYL